MHVLENIQFIHVFSADLHIKQVENVMLLSEKQLDCGGTLVYNLSQEVLKMVMINI